MGVWRRKRSVNFLVFLDRHALLTAFAFIYATLLSFVVLPHIPEEYKASATLRFEPAPLTQKDIEPDIKNEIRLMRSAAFKRDVTQSLKPLKYAENKNAEQHDNISPFKFLNINPEDLNEITPASGIELEDISIKAEDFSSIEILKQDDSGLVEISFTSTDPREAAKKANQYALSYLEEHYKKEKTEKKKKHQEILKTQETPEKALLFQRISSHLNEIINNAFTQDDKISRLAYQEQLFVLGKQINDLEDQKNKFIAQKKKLSSSKSESSSKKYKSIYAAKKKEEETLEMLLDRYGYKHPKIISLKDKIEQYELALRKEKSLKAQQTKAKLNVLTEQIDSLEKQIDIANSQEKALRIVQSSKQALQEKQLQQVYFAQRLLPALVPANGLYQNAGYETVSENSSKVSLPYTVEIASMAKTPENPDFPARQYALALIMGATLLILTIFFYLSERRRSLRYYSSFDIEDDTDMPCVAGIPDVAKFCDVSHLEKTRTPHPEVEKVLSALSLKLDSKFEKLNKEGYVVTLTSSFSNEGKTQTLLWLGRIYANAGKRVVIIDGNFREPNLHEATGRGNTTSIIDYLTQKKTLDEIVHMNERLGIDMIFSQKVPDNANRLLSSSKMSDLIDDLKRRYDVILIDTPSCLTYADVLVFAKLSDQILYNVRYGKTKRESVSKGIKQIQNALKTPISFILAQIDPAEKHEFHYT
ncbi:MAG: AAA family ATPase [Alphaproteobacteria bacterium]|nr:AAA family ATPase [Alphaproteobacteria bacterium]